MDGAWGEGGLHGWRCGYTGFNGRHAMCLREIPSTVIDLEALHVVVMNACTIWDILTHYHQDEHKAPRNAQVLP